MDLLVDNGKRGGTMPRLILFAPCENLIVSNENKISLISLLEGVSLGLPPNQPVPPNATIPMRWFAVTIWEKQASDEGKEFESYVEAGHIRSHWAKFRMTKPKHRVVAQIIGFPVQFGEMRLKAHLREVGAGDDAVVGEYPLSVQQIAVTAPGQSN